MSDGFQKTKQPLRMSWGIGGKLDDGQIVFGGCYQAPISK